MAATPNADTAVSVIEGGRDAHRLIIAISDGLAPADALLAGLRLVESTGDAARLAGFCRGLQKALERWPGAIR